MASNAAKYGALSMEAGQVDLECAVSSDMVTLLWRENGGPRLDGPPTAEGFGNRLIETTVQTQLGGSIARRWQPEGLTVRVVLSRACCVPPAEAAEQPQTVSTSAANM